MKRKLKIRNPSKIQLKWENIWILMLPSILFLVYLYNNIQKETKHSDIPRPEQWTNQISGNSKLHQHIHPHMNPHITGSPVTYIYTSDGEALAANVTRLCTNRSRVKAFQMKITTNNKYNVLLCPLCKLASTFWTRFFVMLRHHGDNVITPYDIPIAKAPPSKEVLRAINGRIPYTLITKYKFIFVRNPYARVLSAYVDKLFAPNPVFWKNVGRRLIIIQRHLSRKSSICGYDLSFQEYVTGIVRYHSKGGMIDCHDAEFHSSCHVCELNYNFIGKMETFANDSFFLFQKLGLNKTIDALAVNYSKESAEDALYDTVSSAFQMRTGIEDCHVSFDEALRRVWRKLQIRGAIGKHPYPLSLNQSLVITQSEFLNLARSMRDRTPPSLRKQQRRDAMIEIYRTLPISLLEQLRHVYTEDFEFFQYDPTPDYLFNRDFDIDEYGYLNV